MIANLETYYPNLESICYLDEDKKEVYLNDKRVTVDNSIISGYVRRDNGGVLEPINAAFGEYEIKESFVFVGSVPNGDLNKVIQATRCALVSCNSTLKNWTTDKIKIAESEGIDLSKFTNVVLIMVEYDYNYTGVLNNCDGIDM
ncbi:MAG: hypothetical protein GY756_26880, partial [bacterium]|nr:hypothetical protein [bacterium]